MDESADRKVLLNTDDSINENLPKDIIQNLKNIPNSDLNETNQFVDSLLKKNYVLKKHKGVPQGASTSCGLATLNIEDLFREDENLIGYSDDGVKATNLNEVPNLDIKPAGVAVNLNKSGFVKSENKWSKSLKFLGLEFIPAFIKPLDGSESKAEMRLRGSTRRGSKFEFDIRMQFMCYLSKIYEGLLESALKECDKYLDKHWAINDELKSNLKEFIESLLSATPTIDIEDWVNQRWEEFENITEYERINLLFNSPLGPNILAKIYKDSENLSEPSDTRLMASKGSWATSRYGGFLHELGLAGFEWILTAKRQVLSSWKLKLSEEKNYDSQLDKIDLQISRIHDWLYPSPLVGNINHPNDQCSSESSKERVDELEKTEMIFNSLFKWKDSKIQGKINEFRDKFDKEKWLSIRNDMKGILREARLTLYNSSTIACFDLLQFLQTGRSLKAWHSDRKILHCRCLFQTPFNRRVEQELFTLSKAKRREKLIKKMKREVKRNFLKDK